MGPNYTLQGYGKSRLVINGSFDICVSCLPQDATDELDALLLSLTENLLDYTTTPQVKML